MKNKLFAFICGIFAAAAISATASAAESHTISHQSGVYGSTQLVRVTADEGVNVYYTTNGTLPTEDSKPCTDKPIAISRNTVLRTAAYQDGVLIEQDKATIKIRTAMPRASRASGEYDHPFRVSLSCADKNAKIYYTTDGSVPTKNATLYTAPIAITEDTTLKFVAIRSGRSYSKYYTRKYTVDSDVYPDAKRQELFELVNGFRAENGLTELTELPELSEIAELRAEECAAYFSHWRPNGTKWVVLLEQNGLMSEARAENIAYYYPTAERAMGFWLGSYYHRQNLLNPDTRYVGLGHYEYGGVDYWVQLFIGEPNEDI